MAHEGEGQTYCDSPSCASAGVGDGQRLIQIQDSGQAGSMYIVVGTDTALIAESMHRENRVGRKVSQMYIRRAPME